MPATFCLRLACGLMLALGVLAPGQVPPRFFRVQYLTALGLTAVAGFFLHERADVALWSALVPAMLLAFVGSIVWHLRDHPADRVVLVLASAAFLSALMVGGQVVSGEQGVWARVDDLASAAVLGAAMSAMLMGHAYLIAPSMSLSPLYRLLAALGVALCLRALLACLGLYWWTAEGPAVTLERETLLWLGARWIIGLVGPLVLGWLAWETARIRSTQSATGILYVVVILGFLGELTSQLLLERTGFIL